jgi:hypothetical protein
MPGSIHKDPFDWLRPIVDRERDRIELNALCADAKLSAELDLRLMSWADRSGVPASGNDLVIVGTDNTGRLHIRFFDSSGKLVTDLDESKLDETKRPKTQANAIATLRQIIPRLLPPHVLTAAEKAQVIAEVTSIVGQTLSESARVKLSYWLDGRLESIETWERRKRKTGKDEPRKRVPRPLRDDEIMDRLLNYLDIEKLLAGGLPVELGVRLAEEKIRRWIARQPDAEINRYLANRTARGRALRQIKRATEKLAQLEQEEED